MTWVLLGIAVATNVSATLTLKYLKGNPDLAKNLGWFSQLFSISTFFGLCLYGISFLAYKLILQKLPSGLAYGLLTGLTLCCLLLLSSFFGESLSWKSWFAFALIAIGLVLLASETA